MSNRAVTRLSGEQYLEATFRHSARRSQADSTRECSYTGASAKEAAQRQDIESRKEPDATGVYCHSDSRSARGPYRAENLPQVPHDKLPIKDPGGCARCLENAQRRSQCTGRSGTRGYRV